MFRSAAALPVTSATAKVVVPARLNRMLFNAFTELLAVIDEALVPPTVTVPRSSYACHPPADPPFARSSPPFIVRLFRLLKYAPFSTNAPWLIVIPTGLLASAPPKTSCRSKRRVVPLFSVIDPVEVPLLYIDPEPEKMIFPPFTTVAPVVVLFPLKVSSPTPSFVNPPVPVITPLKVLFAAVILFRFPLPMLIVPAPAIEPSVSLKLFIAKVAPPATDRLETSANRSAAPKVNVPSFTVVEPVYVFAPERISLPAPVFERFLPAPEITPEIVPISEPP